MEMKNNENVWNIYFRSCKRFPQVGMFGGKKGPIKTGPKKCINYLKEWLYSTDGVCGVLSISKP